jgi:hypothetical protein
MAERLNGYISWRELLQGDDTDDENKQNGSVQNELRSNEIASYSGIPTHEAKIVTLDRKTWPIVRQNTKHCCCFQLSGIGNRTENISSANRPMVSQQ